ncbi:antitoxin [Azospirillum sp. TSO22-1]|uniref:antitoxin n=1 Tax=Azospirillum sp. TSO22-1 TaxID=716789 RepID=UPI0011B44C8B|nr:antitoxin [Azospirillum sp. TSO22-1]
MAESAHLFEAEDDDAKRRAVAEARAELAAGKGVPHERVREWLNDLAAGRRTPKPGA